MTIFEIRDSSQKVDEGRDRTLGYLFYYDRSKRFYTELLEGISEWDAPAMFFGHVKRNEYSIDSEWSMKWVRQRIIPAERQNIASVLKDNGLKQYDEYRLLLLSEGRCAQDEQYIVRTDESDLPEEIKQRLKKKVLDVTALSDRRLVVFFRNKTARILDMKTLAGESHLFDKVMGNEEIFSRVMVSPGGNGIEWDEDRVVSASTIERIGTDTDLRYEDFLFFARNRLFDTAGVSKKLGVSRQYIHQLIQKGRLSPAWSDKGVFMFAKAGIESEM